MDMHRFWIMCKAIEAGVENDYRTYKPGPLQYFVDKRQVSQEDYNREVEAEKEIQIARIRSWR